MVKIVVLGGYGIIGKEVVRDLFDNCKECEIIIAGRNEKEAKDYAKSFRSERVKGKKIDIKNISETSSLLEGYDVCINAVQYYFNIIIMKACLKAKVNYIDLGGLYHYTLKQLKLRKQFENIGKIAVLGCGSTPGITNVMARYAAQKMKKVKDIEVSFGGYDKTKYSTQFVLPYSIQTIFDEFTMKPVVYKKGKIRFVEPLSGVKKIIYPPPVGEVKGFYTLHSELATFPDSFRKEGLENCSFIATFDDDFIREIKFFIEAGFASDKQIEIEGKKIKMRELSAKIMDKFVPDKKIKINDLEIIRVKLSGETEVIMDAFAKTNKKNNVSAGVYDTAVSASIMGQMVALGEINGIGVFTPENCVPPEAFFSELAKREIIVRINGARIN